MMRFLKRRISAAVWELLLLLVLAIVFATVYRLYFSRAVALTQVCIRLQDIQNDENAEMFTSLTGDVGQWLQEVNRVCEIRRPL
jgi:hypothetical protein